MVWAIVEKDNSRVWGIFQLYGEAQKYLQNECHEPCVLSRVSLRKIYVKKDQMYLNIGELEVY